jgi:hypothetical protein
MKTKPSDELADDLTLPDEEMDDLEAWTPEDLDPLGSFSMSRMADLAE